MNIAEQTGPVPTLGAQALADLREREETASSVVYDPRDPSQRVEDAGTWKRCSNEALLLADADRRAGIAVRWEDVATLAAMWDAHRR